MVDQGFSATKTFGKALILLNRYFSSVPTLKRLNELNASEPTRKHIVSKAKSNVVAYEPPSLTKKGPGRPRKKGAVVKLKTMFKAMMQRLRRLR